jgi:hypothetical protein
MAYYAEKDFFADEEAGAEAPSWPTGSGGIGSAQGAQRPSTGRAPGI